VYGQAAIARKAHPQQPKATHPTPSEQTILLNAEVQRPANDVFGVVGVMVVAANINRDTIPGQI